MSLLGSTSDRPPVDQAVEELVRSLIGDSSPLELHVERGHRRTTFVAVVDDEDVGRLVGRRGRTAEAIRTLLRARGRKEAGFYGFEVRSS